MSWLIFVDDRCDECVRRLIEIKIKKPDQTSVVSPFLIMISDHFMIVTDHLCPLDSCHRLCRFASVAF